MPYEVIEQRIENAPAARVPHTSTIGVRWVLGYLAWLFIIIMLVWAFAFAVVSPAFASASAVIRASQERGFARLIIGFSELPKFESEIDAGIFVLSFDKTVDVDVSRLAEAIPEYVGQARRDPDGKALRIALTRSYHVNIMEAGLELFIDLLSPEWKGLPPPLPAATIKALTRKAIDAARRQAELVAQRKAVSIPYKLKVRLGRHPTFSRIVFQWNKFVTFNLTRTGRRVELKFNKRAKVDLSQARSDPPKFLQNINVVKNPDGMTMHLTVDEDVDIRGFREGLNYVLDLTGPDALAEASAAAVAKKIAGKKKSAGSKKSVPPAEKTEMTVMTAERENSVVVKPVHSKNVRIVRKNIDPGVLSAASFAENKPEEPDISRAANAEPSAKSAGEDDAAQASAQKAREPTSVPPDGAKNAKAQPDDAKNAKVQPDGAKDAKVQPDAKTSSVAEAESGSNQADSPMARAAIAGANNAGASLRFTFQFEKPVAAAVFRRGHSIWSVFDSKARLDLKGLRQAGKGIIEDIKQVHFGDAQYIRITLKKPQLVHVTYSNNGWHLAIGEMASGNTNPLEMVRALRGDKRSLIKIKMKNYGRVHWLTDPEIGDRIAVVTAFPPQRNVAKPQQLVDFTTFATAHGIAIRPRIDDVAVRLHVDEVLVTSHSGLILSAGTASQYVAGKKPLRDAVRIGFIDFKRWTIESPNELSDKIHEMLRLITEAYGEEVNARRFDLAMLYMANSLYAEALGLLYRMDNVDTTIESDPAYNVLRGATLVLMGRQKEARKDFKVHALAIDSDASLWRGMIASMDKQWENALLHFQEGADEIGSYRPDIQARFRLAAARAALETKKLSRMAAELNAIPRKNLPASLRAQLQLMTGRYLESLGRTEEARESYETALKSSVQSIAAEARLHAIELDLRTGKINREQALDMLESLQLFWRGDDIELRTLRLLANLYVKEKRYGEGFAVMRNSIDAFPKQEIALRIQDDMKLVFKNLFLHGESEEMDPVRALSLYYGYRELTPVGHLGDNMIRNLVDRLISVDLLDQASELLDHQVTKRLKGAARAQVATQLAMVHLMNHKANLALRIIRHTRQAGLPEDLQKNRNLLEARALGELGRSAAAIEILSTMDGEEVERLKADAYWSARNWKGVGRQIEKMLGGRWREVKPLSEQERFNVLRAAIGYSLAGDQFALDRIHRKFYSKLVKTPDADAFILVTKPITAKGVAFRNLAKEIAAIDTLDAFMKEFKARFERTSSKSSSGSEKTAG